MKPTRKNFSFNFWTDEVQKWKKAAEAARQTLTDWLRAAANEKIKEERNGGK